MDGGLSVASLATTIVPTTIVLGSKGGGGFLGAAALGDIGKFFPDNDENNRDLNSSKIIRYCLDKINELNLEIYNIDTTVICEKPKINPYREEILQKLSSLLMIPVSRIGLKATTSEEIGIIGENNAIAVQSLVNLREKL